jgi:hypothetical protein
MMSALRVMWVGNTETLDRVLRDRLGEADLDEDGDEEMAAPTKKAVASKVKPNVISGALCALTNLLRVFPQVLDIGSKKLLATSNFPPVELITYAIRAVQYGCSDPSKRISLDVPEVGLRFCQEHLHLFAPHLLPHARRLFDLLLECCHLKARARVRNLAQPVLLTLVQIVGSCISGDSTACGTLDAKAEFRWFVMERFMKMLKGSTVDADSAAGSGTTAAPNAHVSVDSLLGIKVCCVTAFV